MPVHTWWAIITDKAPSWCVLMCPQIRSSNSAWLAAPSFLAVEWLWRWMSSMIRHARPGLCLSTSRRDAHFWRSSDLRGAPPNSSVLQRGSASRSGRAPPARATGPACFVLGLVGPSPPRPRTLLGAARSVTPDRQGALQIATDSSLDGRLHLCLHLHRVQYSSSTAVTAPVIRVGTRTVYPAWKAHRTVPYRTAQSPGGVEALGQ